MPTKLTHPCSFPMISPCHSPKMGASIAVSLNVCLNRWNTQEVEDEATFEELIQNSLIESKQLSNASGERQTSSSDAPFRQTERPYPQYPPHLHSRQYSQVARPRWPPVFPRSCNPRLDRSHFTYIGSATNRNGGLAARKYTHDNPSKQERKSFNSHLVHGDIKRTSKFSVLFSIPTSGLKNDEFITIRQISIVAEAIYANIFGAYSDHVKDQSLYQTVYGDSRQVFSWRGACSHFCLLEGVRGI